MGEGAYRTGGADVDARWQRMIDVLAPLIVRADQNTNSKLQRFSQIAFWSIISGICATAYIQGEAFGADKQSATIVGGLIGVASFFAWLAVDEDEDDDDYDDLDDVDECHAHVEHQRTSSAVAKNKVE